ncbi:glycosyl hydrolase family 28-related protein [Algibacillus agarilyticus]|uniref:glycosyl hydrolase family 28-related protein n=1 Tax=Algibacillus agarilyticus TaxID=2234133 RepID=UPI000DD04663|nr:glycosyl hydrolase family 28-related protein [Algibacillus agarilyticus]
MQEQRLNKSVLFQPDKLKKYALTSFYSIVGYALISTSAHAVDLANANTFSAKSDTWSVNYAKAFDGNLNNEARAKARGNTSDVWLEFNFGAQYKNFDVNFLEDNQYPYSVSRWKVQGWRSGEWQDINNWQAHNTTSTDPAFPIPQNYNTNRMRVLFQASKDNEVGLNELNISGVPVNGGASNGPTPIVDSQFYTEPTQYSVSYNLVNHYGVNNNDNNDDSALLQQAIDEISAKPKGGKLFIPSGKYYLLNVQMRSNVHIEIASGATIFPTWNGDGRNHRIFEVGTGSTKVENFSLTGRNNGFTVDFRQSNDVNLAVFNLGDVDNFKISNFKIEDNKTIFASLLVNAIQRGNNLYWPHNGIIEKIDQRNALFGYGVIQTYGGDNILFRDLKGEGGITLRMETDTLIMKELQQGGIRDIYAENISCTNGLAAVMFGPHFMENGSVEVNGVQSNGCGFAVRVDKGFVELFSPTNETHTRNSWKAAVEAEIGTGCAATPYARGNGGTRWASRINDIPRCLDEVYRTHHLKPGTFEKSDVYNVTATYGTNAHVKQDQLDYFDLMNPSCSNVCLPTTSQWAKPGQIYLGPSLGAIIDKNVQGEEYNFEVIVHDYNMVNFPNPHHEKIDSTTTSNKVCNYYGMSACPNNRWN